MPSHAHEAIPDDVSTRRSSDPSQSLVADPEELDAAADRHRLCVALVSVYNGDAYRLLTDVADLLGASIAYVDRPTVEAHLERSLSDPAWSAIASQLTAMAFDEHIGDAGTIRTDWIDDVLLRASLTGQIPVNSHPGTSPRHPRGR
ncbi:hypothetical protein O2W15_11280 [Modestobacter sp. VKM Ac-2979]|uniref:hypothetical protein n=1 Tax=unclassified Modestobacter TaxID=2643866 RepID=UPI0022ABBABD|nr:MULTISPECIES: hypothetical protein [unclassified Modestobacter]MCZ2812016.1 hypothetical protein [Modestobacter sp. VKM Ac-2979]MCZ2843740.1 hypothetical protein [Modestobacter sp. VKM Ac-2980]